MTGDIKNQLNLNRDLCMSCLKASAKKQPKTSAGIQRAMFGMESLDQCPRRHYFSDIYGNSFWRNQKLLPDSCPWKMEQLVCQEECYAEV